jgi:hypothetical protein
MRSGGDQDDTSLLLSLEDAAGVLLLLLLLFEVAAGMRRGSGNADVERDDQVRALVRAASSGGSELGVPASKRRRRVVETGFGQLTSLCF